MQTLRQRLLAELELLRDTGRAVEAHVLALRCLHQINCPGILTNDLNPLKGDHKALEPFLLVESAIDSKVSAGRS